MEGTRHHGQSYRNIGEPGAYPADDHGMKQMGMNDVEALAPQQAGKRDDLSGKGKQIRYAEKTEVARQDRDSRGSESIHQRARGAVQYHRNIIAEAIAQVAELFVYPNGAFRRGNDVADPLR